MAYQIQEQAHSGGCRWETRVPARASGVLFAAAPPAVLHVASPSTPLTFLPHSRLSPCSDPRVWRPAHTSTAAGACNSLLARRSQRQLSTLSLPAGRTNVGAEEELEFMGELCLRPYFAAAPMESPLHEQQPQEHHQRQQAAAAAAQKVQRPRARRLAQRGPSPQQHGPLPVQQPQHMDAAQCPPYYTAMYTPCYRQQVAPPPQPSGWGGFPPPVEAARSAVPWLHRRHRYSADLQQLLHQQEQQQQQCHHQQLLLQQRQQQPSAEAGWPYSLPPLPQQKAACWAFTSSQPPLVAACQSSSTQLMQHGRQASLLQFGSAVAIGAC